MSSFSQRQGFKPGKSTIQIEEMDEELRNSLWSAFIIFYWKKLEGVGYINYDSQYGNYYIDNMCSLIQRLWLSYFKQPLDTLPEHEKDLYQVMRKYFFNCKWNEAYDFVEFVARNHPDENLNIEFREFCNNILEKEISAYRFIERSISPITSEVEIGEIENALAVQDELKPVAEHLRRALDLLSQKKSPDYRNSIKESISAIEAICQLITSDNKATLGKALKEIEKKIGIHPSFKSALDKLYGYTSDADGIRHALLEESSLGFEDAKFMLVVCSAFTNFIISKSLKAEISL
jgi:hypothetical protein